jgi:DNA-binding beta-propeller fold protein YncE
VDSAAGKMYLASEDTSSIQRANLGGPTSDVIVSTSPMQPGGIALDLLHGKVYWTKNDAPSNISRANLDGTSLETFLSGPAAGQSFGSLFGIAVDAADGTIYFSDESASRIYRSNLDGSSVVDITPASVIVLRPHGLALDLSAGQLYWAQNGGIGRLDLDLSAAKLFAVPSNPLNLAVVPEPNSALLAVCGLATLLTVKRRRRPN